MTTPVSKSYITPVLVIQYCPLCGEVLEPESDQILCAECEVDQSEKWADYQAEQAQAYHPY